MTTPPNRRTTRSFGHHSPALHRIGSEPVFLRRTPITGGKTADRSAFSLIELLVVVGIVVLLAAIMAPALGFLRGSGDLGIAGNKVSGLLDQSRAYAMARNTYVWAGLGNVNPGGPVAIASVYSRDGTANTNATNLIPLGKLIVIDNVCLASVPATNAGLNRQTADTNLMSGASSVSFSLNRGGVTYNFTNTIGFNSQGVAFTQGVDLIPKIIEAGLVPSRNTNSPPSPVPANVLVFQVSGITGTVKTYRP